MSYPMRECLEGEMSTGDRGGGRNFRGEYVQGGGKCPTIEMSMLHISAHHAPPANFAERIA